MKHNLVNILKVKIILYLIIFTFSSCSILTPYDIGEPYYNFDNLPEHLELVDPSNYGSYTVLSFYYGSIYNPRRKEYSIDNIKVLTNTEDISPFFTNIKDEYWGFDANNVPKNGKVWYPEEKGNYPLILCVHGNHNPYEYSEFGYDYLGEMLASRGYIFVSIDENFLNGRSGSENDARAILMLEHAKEIITWNKTNNNPLQNKIDIDNICLIGHSRGGEAVVTASILNNYSYYPEDSNIKLDYGLSIKAVVSIAPVEGQYRPGGRLLSTPSDVNYLVIHGSYDGDVTKAVGLRFINRGKLRENNFRASFWIYGANHAQFNTTWAESQDPNPTYRKNLLTSESQQKIAKTLISAFLEVSFDINKSYLAFFEDYRKGINWLPQTLYITQYRDGKGTMVADYEEDENIKTATAKDWNCIGKNFSIIKEYTLPIISNILQETYSLFLKWDNNKAVYNLYTENNFISGSVLSFDMAFVKDYDDDYNYELDFDIIIETYESIKLNYKFSDYYYLIDLPEVWLFYATNLAKFKIPSSDPIKHYILQTINIPLTGKTNMDSIIIKSIEFVFGQPDKAYILLDNIKIK